MSYPVIKYKNPSNNEYNFLYDVLKKNGSTVSKKSLTQYFLSNNTSVVFPVLNNQIKNPHSNLKVYDYFASTFDQDSFKSFFNQTGYFDKLLNFLPSSTVPLKELESMKTNGPSNQRQFRIFILAQVLNTFKVE